MRKAVLSVFAVFICMLGLRLPAHAADTSAQAAILWNAETGDVLYELEADTPLPIASVTKLVTALVTVQHCHPEEMVTVSPEAAYVEGSSIYLAEGEELSVETLLYGRYNFFILIKGDSRLHCESPFAVVFRFVCWCI